MKAAHLVTLVIGFIIGAGVNYSWATRKPVLPSLNSQNSLDTQMTSKIATDRSVTGEKSATITEGAKVAAPLPQTGDQELAACLEQNAGMAAENKKLHDEFEDMGYQQRSLEDSPEIRQELASRLIDTLEIDKTMDKTLEVMSAQFAQQFAAEGGPDAENIKTILQQRVVNEEFYNSIGKAYGEAFSPSELDAMIRFNQSEVGQASINKSPELAAKISENLLSNLKKNDALIKEDILALKKNAANKPAKM